ncbi:MAG: hypothetical protein FWG31_09995 [Oscillospiraceae bacterium]|nr:hypothetical protein [Oscillospiraceae bacterium]
MNCIFIPPNFHPRAVPVTRGDEAAFSWGDSYELDIADPQNELLCLCVALAVDCALDAKNTKVGVNI